MKHQVTVIETHVFAQAAAKYLSAVELDAIRHLLAAKPGAGEPSPAHPEILHLVWHARDLRIAYLVSQDTKTIYLLTIEPTLTASQPDAKTKQTLKQLKRIGIGIGVKELIEKLLELF